MLTQAESEALNDCLAEDEQHSKVMRTAAPGAPKSETMSSAIGKGLAKGFSLFELLKVAAVGYATGGYAGAVAAVLAYILNPVPAPVTP